MKFAVFTLLAVCSTVGLTFAAQIPVAKGLLEAEEFDCPTGVRLVENECNGCFCTSEGELACTFKQCPENKGKGLENCTLWTSWRQGCNKCWCISIGTVCTDKKCDNSS